MDPPTHAGDHADGRQAEPDVDQLRCAGLLQQPTHAGDGAVPTGEGQLENRAGHIGHAEQRREDEHHRQGTQRELPERVDAAENEVGCRLPPDPPGGWQPLPDHDTGEDDVDHQARQPLENRHHLRRNETPSIGELSEDPRSDEQQQEPARSHCPGWMDPVGFDHASNRRTDGRLQDGRQAAPELGESLGPGAAAGSLLGKLPAVPAGGDQLSRSAPDRSRANDTAISETTATIMMNTPTAT